MAQEQYQQGQGQMGMSQGPFSQYLQGYAQQPYTQAQPGISPAAGAASIATQVLQHMRNYRIQDYMMKEQERERQEGAYHTAIQAVQNSNLGSQYKSNAISKLMTPFLATIAGEKPGQSEQAGGHPVVGMLRQYASNLFGGNVPKNHIGNFDMDTVKGVMADMNNPAYSRDTEIQNAHAALAKDYQGYISSHNGALPSGPEVLGWGSYNNLVSTHVNNGLQPPTPYTMGLNLMPDYKHAAGAMEAGYQAAPGAAQGQAPPPNLGVTPVPAPVMPPASNGVQVPPGYHPNQALGAGVTDAGRAQEDY